LLFPDVGTNRNSLQDDGWGTPAPAPDHDPFWHGCDVVVRGRVVNPRVAGVSIEGRASAAAMDGDRLVHWASTQSAHGARRTLAFALGLDAEQVRVVVPDVGGGFGPKINLAPEDVLVAWVARHLGRAVTWVETRTENLLAQSQGRGQVHDLAIGGTRDGRVLAYEVDIRADSGAYPLMGSFLPHFTRLMATGVYDIERVRTRAEAVVTNTAPVEAYRGSGRPEATVAVERAMDLFAAELGLDPVEVRRANLIPPFDDPWTTPTGAVYDCGDYGLALDRALAAADVPALRREQAERRAAGDRKALGIGVAVYVEITGAGVTSEYARVAVREDPTAPGGVVVEVHTGSSPHGQGLHTALATLVAERLGVPLAAVRVVHGDTDVVPEGMGTMGSRSLQMGGSAVHGAAGEVLAAGIRLVASEFGVAESDIVVDPGAGALQVADIPACSLSWRDVARLAARERLAGRSGPGGDDPLDVGRSWSTDGLTFPNGCHVAVVEVDLDTGLVDLLRLVAADDAGRILNPTLAEGQRHGGIAQGVAQALFEGVRHDPDGNPLTTTLADYGIPSAADLPPWDLVEVATPTPMNVLGAKGVGESGTIGATPAVQSAVVDALAHLGVRHLDMPLTPVRVWEAIRTAGDPS
jgi:carbon-monoxide dehydrogenase large subunit